MKKLLLISLFTAGVAQAAAYLPVQNESGVKATLIQITNPWGNEYSRWGLDLWQQHELARLDVNAVEIYAEGVGLAGDRPLDPSEYLKLTPELVHQIREGKKYIAITGSNVDKRFVLEIVALSDIPARKKIAEEQKKKIADAAAQAALQQAKSQQQGQGSNAKNDCCVIL